MIAITRENDSALALAGRGRSVEWAVEMRRFDETKTLDRLADDNAIDLSLADELARVVAASHARTPVVAASPWVAELAAYIDRNTDVFRRNPDLFDAARTDALSRHSAIVDAVFARSEERNALRAVALARGVEFRGIFLIADVATRIDRISARRGDASDADIAVARAQECYAVGQNDWLMCDASNTSQVTLDRARKLLQPEGA